MLQKRRTAQCSWTGRGDTAPLPLATPANNIANYVCRIVCRQRLLEIWISDSPKLGSLVTAAARIYYVTRLNPCRAHVCHQPVSPTALSVRPEPAFIKRGLASIQTFTREKRSGQKHLCLVGACLSEKTSSERIRTKESEVAFILRTLPLEEDAGFACCERVERWNFKLVLFACASPKRYLNQEKAPLLLQLVER